VVFFFCRFLWFPPPVRCVCFSLPVSGRFRCCGWPCCLFRVRRWRGRGGPRWCWFRVCRLPGVCFWPWARCFCGPVCGLCPGAGVVSCSCAGPVSGCALSCRAGSVLVVVPLFPGLGVRVVGFRRACGWSGGSCCVFWSFSLFSSGVGVLGSFCGRFPAVPVRAAVARPPACAVLTVCGPLSFLLLSFLPVRAASRPAPAKRNISLSNKKQMNT